MSRVTELEKALTTLFCKGTEVGYTETEIDEFLENIDYHALLQAVWNKAETVYAYCLILRIFEVFSRIQSRTNSIWLLVSFKNLLLTSSAG